MSANDNIKNSLMNEELNAIQFVMDYLQVHFNSKGFTFYIWPSINVDNEIYHYGDIAYRNKLCEFIEKKVVDVFILDDFILVIEFKNGDSIRLSLDSDNPDIISEIAIFHDEDGTLSIFE
ncbi:MAG: hypothetical protein Aureis2KO_01490 [Aureisphaera sp.]